MIALEAIESSYINRENKVINLQRVNLKIELEDSIAIIGKKHAGKTALLRCIAGLDTPKSGSIKFSEFSHLAIDTKNKNQKTKNLSYVDNTRSLLESKTVFENIALPLILLTKAKNPYEISRQTEAVLKLLNLEDCKNKYPHNLSPLEKVLTCIARAMVTRPRLLICDEITTGLDLKSSRIITQKLRKLKTEVQIALVLATNDLELIKSVCDKVIVLDKGEIIEKTQTNRFFLQPSSHVGKEFIKLKAISELPFAIKKKLRRNIEDFPNRPQDAVCVAIVRASVCEAQNFEQIFGQLIEKLNVTINVVSAYQENIKNSAEEIKLIILELTTTGICLHEALLILNGHGIYSEVLGYVN